MNLVKLAIAAVIVTMFAASCCPSAAPTAPAPVSSAK